MGLNDDKDAVEIPLVVVVLCRRFAEQRMLAEEDN